MNLGAGKRLIRVSAVLAAGTFLLAACGSSKSNSSTTATSTSTTSTTAATESSTKGTSATTTSTVVASSKLTISESAAQKILEDKGYASDHSAGFGSGSSLAAISGVIGNDGHNQNVFFFAGGGYIGTDWSSADISVESVTATSPTQITVTYGTFSPSAALCCSDGKATVKFTLAGGKLVPNPSTPPAGIS